MLILSHVSFTRTVSRMCLFFFFFNDEQQTERRRRRREDGETRTVSTRSIKGAVRSNIKIRSLSAHWEGDEIMTEF